MATYAAALAHTLTNPTPLRLFSTAAAQITDFWASAAKESKVARSDPQIASALQNQLQRENGPSEQFAAWIESVMRAPADGPAEVLRRGARPRDQDPPDNARHGNSDVEELEEFERVKAEMLAKHATAG